MLRFSLFGFSIIVEPWFWLGTALLGAYGIGHAGGSAAVLLLLIWIAVVFVSILWHELGHAFLQRRFGGRNIEICLHSLGGYAQASGDFTRHESRWISLAGPLAGLMIAAVIWSFQDYWHIQNLFVWALVRDLWFVNFVWSLVNLLPILPLDGGRVLEASVDKPSAWLHQVSFVTAIVAGLGFFAYAPSLFLLLFFGVLAYRNYQSMQSSVGGWSPVRWRDSAPASFENEPARKAKKYEPKLRPRVELDREHPAVIETDALLDKISREGFGSLTPEEKLALDRASAELKAKDRRR